MENKDTVNLLRECDLGVKMAITSIDHVLDHVVDSSLKSILTESKHQHEKLENELHGMLLKHHGDEQEPTAIARGMSWLKTNLKLKTEDGDSAIADLVTDGCDMGIKSLHQYKNQYKHADEPTTKICDRLITIEEKLRADMRCHL